MNYLILAAVTLPDAAGTGTSVASGWVEQAIGALLLSTLAALGWLVKNALKKMTEDAVRSEQQKQAEEKRAELTLGLAAVKAALELQRGHCSECHQHVDDRLAKGDTAIELLRSDMAHVLAVVSEMKALLHAFIDAEHARRAGHEDTNPRGRMPRASDEG